MPELGRHVGFVIAAYGLTALALLGLVAWVVADYRRQRRLLSEAEQRRAGRRAAGRMG